MESKHRFPNFLFRYHPSFPFIAILGAGIAVTKNRIVYIHAPFFDIALSGLAGSFVMTAR